MKGRMSKNLTQKILIAILIVLSFNFIAPTSRALGASLIGGTIGEAIGGAVKDKIDGEDVTVSDVVEDITGDIGNEIGGLLLGPFIDFFAAIGDAIISGLQYYMYDGDVGGLNTATGIVSGALNITPLGSFLVKSDKFSPEKYGMSAEGRSPNIIIQEDELDKSWIGGTFQIPVTKYTPEKIFSNQVPALDANFISPKEWDDSTMGSKSVTRMLQEIISSWYNALRNLVVVGLLSVLLYVGIRMMLTSVASDKAKYKQMLMDWLIALCLVFFLHYIMAFTLTITGMLAENLSIGDQIVVQVQGKSDVTFKTDLMGLLRLQVQYEDLGARLIYLMMYLGLVVYTVVFTWKYVKRAVTMAFLTLMAPLVTLTYPIDKIGDGKAQAFNMWLKEYIFNALLQPFHLILYTVFLGSSLEIAVKNPIYAILFLAFMGPAEKLLKKFFGFDKSSTVGALDTAAGVFGGAAAFKMLSGALGKGAKALAHSKGGAPAPGNVRQQKQVEDDNNPKGYAAFANGGGQGLPEGENAENIQNRNAMLEAENENFGTSDWDAQGADAAARANGASGMGMNYSDDQYTQFLRDSGYSENEIQDIMGASTPSTIRTVDTSNITGSSNASRVASPSGSLGSTSRTITTNPSRPESSGQLGRIGRTINGVKAVGGKVFSGKNIKAAAGFAGRTALRVGAGAMMGAVGIGMGIAGGDLEDVLTYGMAGASLGATAGANLVMGAGSGIARGARSAASTFSEGYHGVNQAQIQRQTREFMKRDDVKDYLSQEFATPDGQRLSGGALRDLTQRAAYYNNSGVTDLSSIKKSLKLEDSIKKSIPEGTDMSEEQRTLMAKEQAATIAKIADRVDDKKLMTDEKYAAGLQANFTRGLKAANPDMSQSELTRQSAQMMALLRKYKKID